MKASLLVGETTVTSKNQVSLPAAGMRRLRWRRGDRLVAEVIGDDLLVLMRRPDRLDRCPRREADRRLWST